VFFHAGFPIPGELGVTLFFVLSGFLITGLLLAEHERTRTVSLRRFYLRRSLRIFPAYYVFLAVAFPALVLLHRPVHPASVATALTYTWNYWAGLTDYKHGPISPIWSLAIEEQFYLLWPVSFLAVVRTGRPMRWLVGFILTIIVIRTVLHLGFGVWRPYLYRAFEGRADALAIGCLLAIALRNGALSRWRPSLTRATWLPILTAALAVISWGGPDTYRVTIGYTIEAALLGVFLVQTMWLSQGPGWRWLNARPIVGIGTLSYSIYLWHRLGFSLAAAIAETTVRAVWPMGLLLGIIFALMSYFLVERPGLQLRDRLAG
jgi:peptidoglycan/LPS O-acetylase OafA/YrhL